MPRNSDEEPDWDDDDYVDLTEVIERLEITENLNTEDEYEDQ